MLVRLAPIILAATAAPGSLAFVASPPSHFATSNSVRQQTFLAADSLDTTEKDTETTNDGGEINALMAEAQKLEAEAAALELEADALDEHATDISNNNSNSNWDEAIAKADQEEQLNYLKNSTLTYGPTLTVKESAIENIANMLMESSPTLRQLRGGLVTDENTQFQQVVADADADDVGREGGKAEGVVLDNEKVTKEEQSLWDVAKDVVNMAVEKKWAENRMFFMKGEVADAMQKEQAEAFEEAVVEQEAPMEMMVGKEMAKVAAATAMATEAQEAVAAALEATPTMPAESAVEDVDEEENMAVAAEAVADSPNVKEEKVQNVAAANGIKTMSLRERLNQMNGEPAAQMTNNNTAIQKINDASKKSASLKELMNEPVQTSSGSNSNGNVKSNAAPQNNNNNGGTKKKMSLRELALQTGNK